MREITLRQIKAHGLDSWTVIQKFEKLGKYPVTVRGWGRNRVEALRMFELQKSWAESSETEFLSDVGNWLCDVGAWLDAVSNKIRSIL